MTIRNINEKFGDPIVLDNPSAMASMIVLSGLELPEDGLQEGRDYEVLPDANEFKIFGGNDIEDNFDYYWIFRPCDIKEWSGELVRGWRKIKEIHDNEGVWTARIAKIYLPIDATEEEIIRAF